VKPLQRETVGQVCDQARSSHRKLSTNPTRQGADELDALICAFTELLADCRPGGSLHTIRGSVMIDCPVAGSSLTCEQRPGIIRM
jgi:hypothetical protein